MVIGIILVIIVLVIVIWAISTSNSFKVANVKIDEANSGIDVALTKRYDTLTKMQEVVKGYAKHEQEVIFETIEMRKGMSIQEKESASKKMDDNLSKIYAVAENYPELKSSENYNTFQKAIADTEENLQAARRMYNSNVSRLNQAISVFPSSIIAGMQGVKPRDFFKADEDKKQDVKIDL